MIPSDQLRPSRSNSAMIGLPDFDPRTGNPGMGWVLVMVCLLLSFV
jgi:hypothetical protein